MGYIFLPSCLNATIGITSYYCIILKIVILHDGRKTIQNVFFPISLKKEQNLVSLKTKKNRWIVSFLKKQRVFLNPGLNSCLAQSTVEL